MHLASVLFIPNRKTYSLSFSANFFTCFYAFFHLHSVYFMVVPVSVAIYIISLFTYFTVDDSYGSSLVVMKCTQLESGQMFIHNLPL